MGIFSQILGVKPKIEGPWVTGPLLVFSPALI